MVTIDAQPSAQHFQTTCSASMAGTGAVHAAATLADSEVSIPIPQIVKFKMAPKKRSEAQLAAARRGTSTKKNKAAKKQHIDTQTPLWILPKVNVRCPAPCCALPGAVPARIVGWESSGTIARRLPLRAAGSLNNGNTGKLKTYLIAASNTKGAQPMPGGTRQPSCMLVSRLPLLTVTHMLLQRP